ncbi:MAG: ribonuclease III [Ruminococcaceae bacterium]|nr:ribonuclease III [Oscillospiraceae bacterium]
MQINEMSPSALAYLGDSVLELMTRTMLVRSGVADAGKLNKLALDYVKATAQCDAVDKMMEHLSEEEVYWYKRGRNHSTSSAPKSASTGQYRKATGLEVLFACLYLNGQTERMQELYDIGFKQI